MKGEAGVELDKRRAGLDFRQHIRPVNTPPAPISTNRPRASRKARASMAVDSGLQWHAGQATDLTQREVISARPGGRSWCC